MRSTTALAWLDSLAPLNEVDRIELHRFDRPDRPCWFLSANRWRSSTDEPGRSTYVESPRLELGLPKLARKIHRVGLDTGPRYVDPVEAMERESLIESGVYAAFDDIPKPYPAWPRLVAPPEAVIPVWPIEQASATVAAILSVEAWSGVLLIRNRMWQLHGSGLWCAANGYATTGPSPLEALHSLATDPVLSKGPPHLAG